MPALNGRRLARPVSRRYFGPGTTCSSATHADESVRATLCSSRDISHGMTLAWRARTSSWHGPGAAAFRWSSPSLYIALLVVAGIRAHSLALLSEAGHNLSDFLALLLSLVAVFLEGRPPSATKTYGYRRAGVLAALVNSLSLVVVSFFIFYEAFRRDSASRACSCRT